jgi:hypothetical protein
MEGESTRSAASVRTPVLGRRKYSLILAHLTRRRCRSHRYSNGFWVECVCPEACDEGQQNVFDSVL